MDRANLRASTDIRSSGTCDTTSSTFSSLRPARAESQRRAPFGAQRAASSNGGLSNEQLGIIAFPAVEGGRGAVTETFGGASGFVVTRNASDEAVDFLRYFLGPEPQKRAATEGVYIPTAPDAAPLVDDSILKQFAAIGGGSTFHQLFLDQALGADLGGAVNDVSAQLATRDITPERAAEILEETRQFQ